MKKVLVVVPCGARKIWDIYPGYGPCRARDVYQGPLFKVCRRFAEKFGDRWVILSAKYEFIDPDFIIPENYNVTFNKPSTNPVRVDVLRRQVDEMCLLDFDVIVVLGGRHYVERCLAVFPRGKVKIPFRGLPLGKMMKAIKESIVKNSFDCL